MIRQCSRILRSVTRTRLITAQVLLLLQLGMAAGCDDAATPPADLTKTPWLDPKVQIESLNSGEYRIRGLAAHHLGNIGAPAAEAIPALEKVARDDPEPKVRENAVKALEKIRAATE